MPDEESETSGALSRRERALSRWDNEGGSGPDGHVSVSLARRGQVAMPQMGVALLLNRLCLTLCGGTVAFSPATILDRLGRTWRA
jgi:hypothetical protein